MKKLLLSLLAVSLVCLFSCSKEESEKDNYSKVEELFKSNNIKDYNIDKTIVNSNTFDFEKFKNIFEEKQQKNKNQYKISGLLYILALISQSATLPSNDVNITSGSGYSCSATMGGETYSFHRGLAGPALYNTSSGSTWTTNTYSYYSSNNTYYYSGYDTYNIGLGLSYNTEYEITIRRQGDKCYFTRRELF